MKKILLSMLIGLSYTTITPLKGDPSHPLLAWWMTPSKNDPQYIAFNAIAAVIAGGGIYCIVKGIHKLCTGNESSDHNTQDSKRIWIDLLTRLGGLLQAKIGIGLATAGVLAIVFSQEILRELKTQNFMRNLHQYS